jgi:hypothetical protein
MNAYREGIDAAQIVGEGELRLACHLDSAPALPNDFLPQHAQLQFRQSIAKAAMDPKSKSEVLTRASTVDAKAVGILDNRVIAVSGDIPKGHLVA